MKRVQPVKYPTTAVVAVSSKALYLLLLHNCIRLSVFLLCTYVYMCSCVSSWFCGVGLYVLNIVAIVSQRNRVLVTKVMFTFV